MLGWPASETASALDTSVAAVNSALQRARATLQAHMPATRTEWSAGEPSEAERALLAQLHRAHERGDAALAVSIASQDLRITMPPAPMLFEGLGVIGPLLENALSEGDWRLLPTVANRMPTAASYLRRPATTRTARSSSTSCASSTAGSPRSRRSGRRCSRSSGCRRRWRTDVVQCGLNPSPLDPRPR